MLIWLMVVLFSAGFGGFGPGMMITVLGFLIGTSAGQSSGQFLRNALFALVGTTISGLVESLQRARRRANVPAETFAAILKASVDHLYVLDYAGRYLYVSEGAARILNRKPEDVIGRSWRDLGLSPKVMEPLDALRESVLFSNEPRTAESDFGGSEGVRRFEYIVTPIQVTGASAKGVIIVSRDVTEREQSRVTNARLAAIVESSDDAIIGKNIDGIITSWNGAAERLFGYTAGEVVGKDVTLIIPEDRLGEEVEIIDRLRRGVPVHHYETVRRRKDSSLIDISLTVSPVRDAAGRVIGASKIARDVTERKRAEEAQAQSAVRLEALSRQLLRAQEDERRRIARELHDEIGQALTALKINLQEVIGGCENGAARLEESVAIVDLALHQVRGMALDLRPSILDDLGLVAALEWYVGRHAQRTGLHGRFVADPDDLRAHPEIETACFRIAQEALTNVARHARATRFSVELLQDSEGLHLVVRDDGVGFEPATALRAASRGGSLGLAGMQERVELVGGRIEFVSEPAGGTEVQADFPNTPNVPRTAVEREDLGVLK